MRRVAVFALVCFAAGQSATALAQNADADEPSGSDVSAPEAPGAAPPVPAPAAVGAPTALAVLDTSRDKPFVRLFPNLFTDLKRYPSRGTALTLAIGGAFSLASSPIDDHVIDHATAGGTDQLFHVGGMMGGGYVQVGGAVATYIAGRIARSPRFSHLGADLIRAQALNGFITHGMKMAVRRSRPGGAPGHLPATYSFPSAHASSTWTSATVLWRHLGWKAGVPAALVATFASGSRIQQKQHFLSDVTFGAALGIAAGRTVTVGHGGREFVAAPLITPGGAGVVFTLVQR